MDTLEALRLKTSTRINYFLLFVSLFMTLMYVGSVYSNHKDHSEGVQAIITQQYPFIQAINTTYLPNVDLYEIKIAGGSKLAYTNKNVSYILVDGEIFNPSSKENVSSTRAKAYISGLVRSLPYTEAINVKHGDGSRRIAIFTDPDCPYCKMTDTDIFYFMKNDNITFSYFMNPLNIDGHQDAPLKAKKIWCSDNKEQAWTEWMTQNKLPDNAGDCQNPVEANKKLAMGLGFDSTPVLLFDNGETWSGKITPEKIRELLNR